MASSDASIMDSSPVRVTLEHEGQSFVLQPGQPAAGGWPLEFHKHLAADSQPFDVVGQRTQKDWKKIACPQAICCMPKRML